MDFHLLRVAVAPRRQSPAAEPLRTRAACVVGPPAGASCQSFPNVPTAPRGPCRLVDPAGDGVGGPASPSGDHRRVAARCIVAPSHGQLAVPSPFPHPLRRPVHKPRHRRRRAAVDDRLTTDHLPLRGREVLPNKPAARRNAAARARAVPARLTTPRPARSHCRVVGTTCRRAWCPVLALRRPPALVSPRVHSSRNAHSARRPIGRGHPPKLRYDQSSDIRPVLFTDTAAVVDAWQFRRGRGVNNGFAALSTLETSRPPVSTS
jgi:hypothetical protein